MRDVFDVVDLPVHYSGITSHLSCNCKGQSLSHELATPHLCSFETCAKWNVRFLAVRSPRLCTCRRSSNVYADACVQTDLWVKIQFEYCAETNCEGRQHFPDATMLLIANSRCVSCDHESWMIRLDRLKATSWCAVVNECDPAISIGLLRPFKMGVKRNQSIQTWRA